MESGRDAAAGGIGIAFHSFRKSKPLRPEWLLRVNALKWIKRPDGKQPYYISDAVC
jgi:hypothetical protein